MCKAKTFPSAAAVAASTAATPHSVVLLPYDQLPSPETMDEQEEESLGDFVLANDHAQQQESSRLSEKNKTTMTRAGPPRTYHHQTTAADNEGSSVFDCKAVVSRCNARPVRRQSTRSITSETLSPTSTTSSSTTTAASSARIHEATTPTTKDDALQDAADLLMVSRMAFDHGDFEECCATAKRVILHLPAVSLRLPKREPQPQDSLTNAGGADRIRIQATLLTARALARLDDATNAIPIVSKARSMIHGLSSSTSCRGDLEEECRLVEQECLDACQKWFEAHHHQEERRNARAGNTTSNGKGPSFVAFVKKAVAEDDISEVSAPTLCTWGFEDDEEDMDSLPGQRQKCPLLVVEDHARARRGALSRDDDFNKCCDLADHLATEYQKPKSISARSSFRSSFQEFGSDSSLDKPPQAPPRRQHSVDDLDEPATHEAKASKGNAPPTSQRRVSFQCTVTDGERKQLKAFISEEAAQRCCTTNSSRASVASGSTALVSSRSKGSARQLQSKKSVRKLYRILYALVKLEQQQQQGGVVVAQQHPDYDSTEAQASSPYRHDPNQAPPAEEALVAPFDRSCRHALNNDDEDSLTVASRASTGKYNNNKKMILAGLTAAGRIGGLFLKKW